MVLIDWQDIVDDVKSIERFPSPYGDYGSYQLRAVPLIKGLTMVSVPLRGLWFLSVKPRV